MWTNLFVVGSSQVKCEKQNAILTIFHINFPQPTVGGNRVDICCTLSDSSEHFTLQSLLTQTDDTQNSTLRISHPVIAHISLFRWQWRSSDASARRLNRKKRVKIVWKFVWIIRWTSWNVFLLFHIFFCCLCVFPLLGCLHIVIMGWVEGLKTFSYVNFELLVNSKRADHEVEGDELNWNKIDQQRFMKKQVKRRYPAAFEILNPQTLTNITFKVWKKKFNDPKGPIWSEKLSHVESKLEFLIFVAENHRPVEICLRFCLRFPWCHTSHM